MNQKSSRNFSTFARKNVTCVNACHLIHVLPHLSFFSLAMVSLESKAAWEARARAIGVPDGFLAEAARR